MKFMRTVSLAVIMSFISVVPPIYADTNAVQTANAQKNSSYRFPRINAEMAKQLMSDTLVDRLGFGDYAPVDPLVKKYAANKDLAPLLARLFSVADGYIANLNKRLDETEAAAKSCDRARYDAALNRLIGAYVKASLYLQRKMDSIDALVQAHTEYEQGSNIEAAKFRWSMFWADVHDTLASGRKIKDSVAKIWGKNRKSSRYWFLGQAYSEAYGDMLKRMNTAIRTADYPPFKDCNKPGKGPTLAEADAALAEALAAQKAMDEMDEEFKEQDRLYKKVGKRLDDLIGDASLPDTGSSTGKDSAASNQKSAKSGKSGITQTPVSPDPQKNPDGSFMVPSMPVPTPLITIDVPEMPKLPVVPKNSPLAKYQANRCGLDPRKVCNVLLEDYRAACTKELTAFYKICRQAPSIRNCKARCQANWQQGQHELALAGLAKKHIVAVFGASGKTSDGTLEGIEAEIKENEKRMGQIEEEAKKRVLHIYINQNTGTIIRHNGNRFEPRPPLRYAGTQGGKPHMYERNTIEYLKARNQQLRREIEKQADDAYANGSWPQTALSKWTPDGNKRDGFCTAPQNDQNRAAS